MRGTYTGILFDPTFDPPDLALDWTSHGFVKMNEIVCALTGVFARNGQLIGLAVDAADGRALMLPLLEIPRSARTLAFQGEETLGDHYAWVFAQRFTETNPDGEEDG